MRRLIKNTSLMGGTEIALMFVAVIRNKYLAVKIGPEGFGMFSILQSFFNLANVFAGVWLATASLKYIAEYNKEGDDETVKQIFDMSFFFVFISATIITVSFFIFFRFFRSHFLNPEIIFAYYALFAASYIGTSLANLFQGLLQGLMQFKKIITIRIITSIFNLISVLILVWFFDLTGFFINILLVAFFSAGLLWISSRKLVKFEFRYPDFKAKITKKILSFSGIDIFLGIADRVSEYLQRIFVLNFLNMTSLGLFFSATRINAYLGLLGTSGMFYFKPKMSEKLTTKDRNKILNDYFRMVILTGLISSVLIILFGSSFIKLLFSDRFLGLSSILFIFVIAQFIQNIQLGVLFTVVGMAKLKIHSISTIVSAFLIVLIPYLMLRKCGLIALGVGSIVAGSVRILINSSYLKFKHNIYMNLKNIFYIFVAFIMMLVSGYLQGSEITIKLIYFMLTIIIVAANLKKSEWQKIRILVKEKVSI